MTEPIEIIRGYVSARDAMIDCQADARVYGCESCAKHNGCETRLAWGRAYNAMNAVAQPEMSDINKLPEYAIIAKSIDWEEQEAKEAACID